ncbi:hypothetical protein CL660_002710 [bacterium]|nr:hypothetical protein [bacterium]
MRTKVFLFFLIFSNFSNAADSSNVLSVDRTFFFELIIYISVLLLLNKFLFKPLLELKDDRDVESSVRLERADSMSEQAKELESQYVEKMNQYRIEIDKTSIEKISNAKISAEDLIKEAKNQSLLKIEESRKDLTSAKTLNKIKELSVDDIKSGNDDISKKIREVSSIIKDRMR